MKKYDEAEKRTREFYKKAGITVLESEPIEIADFGKNNLEKIGLQLCVYINTERVCAKEMVLFPHQTCPEHKHVETDGQPGKEETFRVRFGKVYLYVEGEGSRDNISAELPDSDTSVYHEIALTPGMHSTQFIPEHCTGFRQAMRVRLSRNFQQGARMKRMFSPINP